MANQLTADYPGTPGWDDNGATFEMTIVANILHGDYQLANGYGHDKAKEVLEVPQKHFSFVSFLFLVGGNAGVVSFFFFFFLFLLIGQNPF